MGKPLAKQTIKIMNFLRKHPDMKASDVASKFSIHVSRVYQLRRRIKDEEMGISSWTVTTTDTGDMIAAMDPTPGPTPEHEAEARASSAILDAKRTQKELEERLNKYFPARVDKEETTDPWSAKSVDAVLNERGDRYGTFESNAKTCQLLKNVLHAQDGWYRLSYVQREAVEMIMHKISRLVNGDGTYLDTVVDISGYNQLMLDHMRGKNEDKKME